MKYVIEHMEEGFSEWVRLEYLSIAREIGGENLILTSVKPDVEVPSELVSLGVRVVKEDVSTLVGDASKVCLLDPAATEVLDTSDAGRFEYFLFGGILGDHPPRDRTGELRKRGFVGRNLGSVQMSTDTAVRVTQKVLSDGIGLDKIQYVDFPELKFNEHESTEMPFRYVIDAEGNPIMPPGMLELIQRDSEKTLDDFV